MGNDVAQWRAAIGSFRRLIRGPSATFRTDEGHCSCSSSYPYRPAAPAHDPPDVQRVLDKHYFDGLVNRVMLLAAGIESNPGPGERPRPSASDNSSSSKLWQSQHQPKRFKTTTLDSFFKQSVAVTAEQGLPPTLTPDAFVETEKGVAATAPPHIDASVSATIVAPHADGDSAPAVAVCGQPSTCTSSSDSVRCIDVNPPSTETTGNVAVLNDVGNFIGQNISDFQRRELLVNHWQPPADYNFPFSTYNCKGKEYRRNLNQNHLDTYKNWLVLSHTARGLYCKYCSLFNVGGGGLRKTVPLKNLVTEPLLNFKDLLGNEKNSVLAAHEHHQYHKQAVEKGKNFLASYDKPEADVLNQVHTQRLKQILENRERLVPIVRATLFLGRQGASFRGHRDDGQLFSESGDSSASATKNEGNFRELLRLMVASGDTKLEEHLKNAKSNATYISKTSQNQLIESIGEEITQQILTRLHKSLFYSILFDETTDLAHKSQLSAIIRYVVENTVYEDFVGFIDAFADLDGGDGTSDSDEEEWDEVRRAAREESREQEIRLSGIANCPAAFEEKTWPSSGQVCWYWD